MIVPGSKTVDARIGQGNSRGRRSAIFAAQSANAVILLYTSLAVALVGGAVLISRGRGIEPPALLTNAIAAVSARFVRTASP